MDNYYYLKITVKYNSVNGTCKYITNLNKLTNKRELKLFPFCTLYTYIVININIIPNIDINTNVKI